MAKVSIKKIEGSQAEISGEIAPEEVEKYRKEAVEKLGKNMDLPGFRKGKIPEKVIKDKLGDDSIWREMSEMALSREYPKIVVEENLSPITPPRITITKMAPGNPLGFKITVAVMPEVGLPDYKKIAKEAGEGFKPETEVSKEEIDHVVEDIMKKKFPDKEKLPELDDKLAKEIGEFKGKDDLMDKIKEGIGKQKEVRSKEKLRVKIMEKVIAESEVELPDVIVENELDKMVAQFEHDIKRMNLDKGEYLKKIDKTMEDLRKEWKADAVKRAKMQLILNNIAVKEDLLPKKEEVEKETKHLLSHSPKADEGHVRVYVETVLSNENVFKMLEGEKKSDK